MKQVILKILKEAIKKLDTKIKLKDEEILNSIEVPPSSELGDYAFPCFSLAGKLKMSPQETALEIRSKIGNSQKEFQDIQTHDAYINFFLDRKALALSLISEIKAQGDKFGKSDFGQNKATMVEFPSPNTNKPLHIGHLRNMSLGEAISRISEFNGERVIRASLNNDKGVHICKSMLAYQKWGKNKKPSKKIKSDKLVGEFYVLFNKKSGKNEELEKEAHDMLRKWEAGDEETRELWKKMNKWALDGFKETYKNFGIKHDIEYYESDIYSKGKEIILEGVKKGIFKKEDDGAVLINLEKQGLGKKYLLRSDGTTVYMTQDIYLAFLKQKEFNLNKSIYIVGNEQDYHFRVLFYLLEKLGFDSKNLKHLSYGMVNLPEGKMKSREGKVVDADDLISDVQNLVKKELASRGKLSKKQLEERSLKITLAAIKYFLLKIDIKKDMLFNPKKSINFEGDTGPYLLYSYARASSILNKAKTRNKKIPAGKLEEKEIELIVKLSQFKEIVAKSFKDLNPSYIANYSYQLSQTFNEFYHVCPVIGSENEFFRISLVESFKQVLKNSLLLLGIETLEKM
jgi:arginyl-tRNA synthetase